jgi:hypothetical protein
MDDKPIKRLFFADHAELCEEAAVTQLSEAQDGKKASAERAAEALTASESAHAKMATMHRGAGLLSEKLGEIRALDSKTFTDYAESAVSDETVSHEDAAQAFAERKALIANLTGVLENYNASILPRETLATLAADSQLFSAMAQVSSWACLEAAVIRFEAAKPLFEADGSIGFGEHGIAYDLFVLQLQAHKKAADCEAALVQAQDNRQRALAQMERGYK